MKLEYFPVKSLEEINATLREKTFLPEGNEYVEGLMFTKDTGVVMVGNMINSAEPGKVPTFGNRTFFIYPLLYILKKNTMHLTR